jgi:hypothetical protein
MTKRTATEVNLLPIANDRQVGGSHYMQYSDFQPWDAWWHWKLNPFQAVIIKHIVRYKDKGAPMADLEKANHYLEKLIELERQATK